MRTVGSRKFWSHGVTVSAAALTLISGRGAVAQEAAADTGTESGGLAEIRVTATKRGSDNVQNVPLAIQAISGSQLAAAGALDFQDFYRQVPGLAIQDEGPGDKRYVIRGINATGAGTVGVYLDESIVTGENNQDGSGQQTDIKLFDIERVEVLKGPQGTTFGSSSMAGTIRFLTNKPDLDAFSGKVNVGMRSTDRASLGVQMDGAFNLPIVTDRFAIRLAGFYADLPGYISNRFESGANGENSSAGRLSARFAVSDDLTLTAMAMTQRTRQDSKSYYNSVDYSGNPISQSGFEQADLARAPWREDLDVYNATAEYKQSYGTFTATGSRYDRDLTFNRDASLAAAVFFGLDASTTGRSVLSQPKSRTLDSYELRFASSWKSPVQVLVGAFGQEEKRFFRSDWPTVNAQGYPDSSSSLLLSRTVDTRITEHALFGEITYDATDALRLTLGGRYYDLNLKEQSDAIVAAGGGAGAGLGPRLKSSDSGPIGRFNIAYAITSDINSYLQIAQGFRSGGTNDQTAAQLAQVVIPSGYGSDSLWNYEVGIKSAWLDHRLIANAALYYVDWSKLQVKAQATDGTVSFPYTGNGGGAGVKGVEFELHAEPTTGLRLDLSGNYNDAKLTQNNPAPTLGDDGDRLPYVPEWTLAAGADYEFPLGSSSLLGVAGGGYSYTGARATDFNATSSSYHRLDAYSLVDLRLGVKADHWSATLVANNLFNNSTIVNYNEIVPGIYPDGFYINRPRTLALMLSGSF